MAFYGHSREHVLNARKHKRSDSIPAFIWFSPNTEAAHNYLKSLIEKGEIKGYTNLRLNKEQIKHINNWKTYTAKIRYE
jgi:hypothetical protein